LVRATVVRSGWHDVRANRTASALNSAGYSACVRAPFRTQIQLSHTVPRHYILNPATKQIRGRHRPGLCRHQQRAARQAHSLGGLSIRPNTQHEMSLACVRPPGDGYVVEGDQLVSQAPTRLICRRIQANLRSNSPSPRGGPPTHQSPPSGLLVPLEYGANRSRQARHPR